LPVIALKTNPGDNSSTEIAIAIVNLFVTVVTLMFHFVFFLKKGGVFIFSFFYFFRLFYLTELRKTALASSFFQSPLDFPARAIPLESLFLLLYYF